MSKEKLMSFNIVGTLLGVSGLIMIFFSVKFGTAFADTWLASRGGANTDYYHIIVSSYINNCLVAGGILFGFGILIVSLSYYNLLNRDGINTNQ